ncbi:ketosteroid isomerase-like protein [Thiogranum longum]|uniref:Ketosteroid isomerase-like protein n=1 Tax=Thiogranum longum TaxID=1537524 RepID=A0A4R1HD60_9GAMM|nr:nuclear transport factor 2 family protein [Thiogranum longum]TCK17189.1 ketosteroid isomerase-like protein [Thiogranum longum]
MSKPVFPTPEAAEQAFYEAFANADLSAMMAVWAEREFIECIHPMGDRVQGYDAVQESWREIFEGGLRVRFKLSNVHRTQDALIAVHILYEHLSTPGDNTHWPPVIATNVFQLIDNSWRMTHHHASPCPDENGDNEVTDLTTDAHQLH